MVVILDDGNQIEAAVSSMDFDAGITVTQVSPGIITVQIPTGGILEAMLADDSISTLKIVDEAVTTPKLAPGAVTTAKIQAGAVTPTELDRAYAEAVTLSPIAPFFQDSYVTRSTVTTITTGNTTTLNNVSFTIPNDADYDVEIESWGLTSGNGAAASGGLNLQIRDSGDTTTIVETGVIEWWPLDWLSIRPTITRLNQRNITLRAKLVGVASGGSQHFMSSSVHIRAWPRANSG